MVLFDAVELALVHVGRDHARALGGEGLGDCATDSLSCRGDKRDLALQTFRHEVIPPSHARQRHTGRIGSCRERACTERGFQDRYKNLPGAAAPVLAHEHRDDSASVIVARHALLRDALIFDRGLEHHAVGELVDHARVGFPATASGSAG